MYRPARACAGGINSLESNPGLHKRFKNTASVRFASIQFVQDFFRPCEMALSRKASAIWGLKMLRFFYGQTCYPFAQVMDLPASKAKALCTGPYQSEVHMYMSFCVLPSVFVFCFLCSVFCILYSVFCSVCCEFYVHEFLGPPLPIALPPLVVRLLWVRGGCVLGGGV